MLIALHARKSAGLIAAFREKFPARPIVVVLTGTDVYGSFARSRAAMRAVCAADAIVTLQPLAIRRLPAALRTKAVAVLQSAQRVAAARTRRPGTPARFCAIGHVRREKDPLRAAYALRYLKNRDVEVVQAGAILDERYAATMASLQSREPRYRYLGELSHAAARRLLAGCDALVLSSRSEGGANVASEAIANGVAVLASRIDGNVGVFGADYAGYYPVGSSQGLAKLIDRFAGDRVFAQTLTRQVRALASAVTPQRERHGLTAAIALARANASARALLMPR